MKKNYPLSVMRGYKPEVVRFLWFIKASNPETGDITEHSGFTWGGIPNLVNRGKKTIESLKMVDLRMDRVYTVDPDKYPEFLKEWSEHYWDPEWKINRSPNILKK